MCCMTELSLRLSDLGLDLPTLGPFTRQHAAAAGVHDKVLARLVRSGLLRRMLHGVYVASDLPDSITLRCRAARLVVPDDAFACDRTAAWIYTGARGLGPDEHLALPPVTFFRPSRLRALRSKQVRSGERAVAEGDLQELNGLRITTELRTALDLGRLQHTRDLRLWGMDNMLATGAFGVEELVEGVRRFKGERGVVLLRALAPLADGRSESFGESALRLRWYDAGLPRPDLQISLEVDGIEVFRLDLGLPEWRYAAEYDGDQHHSEDRAEEDERRRRQIERRWRYRVDVFRRESVFGRLQDAEVRLRRAAIEAKRTLGERTFIV